MGRQSCQRWRATSSLSGSQRVALPEIDFSSKGCAERRLPNLSVPPGVVNGAALDLRRRCLKPGRR